MQPVMTPTMPCLLNPAKNAVPPGRVLGLAIPPHTHAPLDLDPVQVTMKFVEPILFGCAFKTVSQKGEQGLILLRLKEV